MQLLAAAVARSEHSHRAEVLDRVLRLVDWRTDELDVEVDLAHRREAPDDVRTEESGVVLAVLLVDTGVHAHESASGVVGVRYFWNILYS